VCVLPTMPRSLQFDPRWSHSHVITIRLALPRPGTATSIYGLADVHLRLLPADLGCRPLPLASHAQTHTHTQRATRYNLGYTSAGSHSHPTTCLQLLSVLLEARTFVWASPRPPAHYFQRGPWIWQMIWYPRSSLSPRHGNPPCPTAPLAHDPNPNPGSRRQRQPRPTGAICISIPDRRAQLL
jgi:hypothetical protein